ncbi:MAG TPA: hypothetical protein VHW66_08500 [Stellaceae bacterium]|nr:hypothetical protein [Stellaceae bacterium]
MPANSLDIRPLSGAIGAEIGGVDLSKPLDDMIVTGRSAGVAL